MKPSLKLDNILIARYLKWEETIEPKFHAFSIPDYENFEESNYTMETDELEFHINSNWQMICIKKIGLGLELKFDIADTLRHLKANSISGNLNSETDIFEAIVNFIKTN